jgi:hypothetical protein
MTELTPNQVQTLKDTFDLHLATIKHGVAVDVHTNQVIPDEHIFCKDFLKDGLYSLSRMTCDDAIIGKKNNKRMKPTQENKDLYQCRVGRRAPNCSMYAPGKCAVYRFEDVSNDVVKVSTSQLIEVVRV